MAKQTIGLGTTAGDGTGDELRVGGQKINENFDELYANKDTLDKISEDSSGQPLWDGGEWPVEASPNDHEQDTDTYLDYGGDNQVSAADVKTAVSNTHAPGSDNQDLSGYAPLTSPNFTDKISIASKQLLTTQQAAIAALRSNYTTGELDTEEKIISVINTGFAKINATLAMLAVHGLIDEIHGIGQMVIGTSFTVA